ncbi:unnamed protein product [Orchesella dallaii]|uniref:Uncharacterized protein n=1 Tax=Orchesella dallaii TaxID=48710 RepID=A0ABP1RN00_9HEXA
MEDVIYLSSDDEDTSLAPFQVSSRRRIPPPPPSLPPLNPEDFNDELNHYFTNPKEELPPVIPATNLPVTPEANSPAIPTENLSTSPTPLLPAPQRIDNPHDPPIEPSIVIVLDSSDDETSESENASTSLGTVETPSELSKLAYNLGQQNNALVHLIKQIVPKFRAEMKKVAVIQTQYQELEEAHKLRIVAMKSELEETKEKLNIKEEEVKAARADVVSTRATSCELKKEHNVEVAKLTEEIDSMKSELQKRKETEVVSREPKVSYKMKVEEFRQELDELKKAMREMDKKNPMNFKGIEAGVAMLMNNLQQLESDAVIAPTPSTSGTSSQQSQKKSVKFDENNLENYEHQKLPHRLDNNVSSKKKWMCICGEECESATTLHKHLKAGNTIKVVKKSALKEQDNLNVEESSGDKIQSKKTGKSCSLAGTSTKESESKRKRKKTISSEVNPKIPTNGGKQEKEPQKRVGVKAVKQNLGIGTAGRLRKSGGKSK